MEIDIDTKNCSSNIINENILNKETNVHLTNNEEDIYINVEDDDDDDEVYNEQSCDVDDADEQWEIEDDSDESDTDFLRCTENKQTTLETKRKVIVPNRKLKNSNSNILKPFSGNEKIEELNSEIETNLPTAKKSKYFKDYNKKIDSGLNAINFDNIYKKNTISKTTKLSDNKEKSVISNKLCPNNDDKQNQNETNISSNLSNLYSSTSLPGPSGINRLQLPSNSHTKYTNDTNSKIDAKEKSSLLFDFFNKIFLNEYSIPITESEEINQRVEAIPIQECDLIKHLSKNMTLENNYEESQRENSECFVEDPDIVNPDIMYNITLNEHYKQMDILVQKISKASDDLTVLHECMQLMPIPKIEHQKTTFTTEERINFLNGVSEWEYDIDGDDWNKIMVKRSVVFTAHAGFSIANEESLYVLADVAIDYIKQLAVIMKKNFDIQSKSSLPDKIDPIDNSLQEIGVKGGVRELIKHYENDVFVRRNKLMKKCQHLQKIIDQYIERMFLDTTIKNQYVVKEDLGEKNSTNEKYESISLKENESIIDEINTEIHEDDMVIDSTIEKNVISNVNNEQKEIICIDKTANEIKIDTDQNNVENINTNEINISAKKKNPIKITKKKLLDYNLIKPMIPDPIDCEPESIICKFNERFSNKNDLESQFRSVSYIDTPESSEEKDQQKSGSEKPVLYDLDTVKEMMKHLNSPQIKKPIKQSLKLHKMLKEFDDDFKCYKRSHNKSDDD